MDNSKRKIAEAKQRLAELGDVQSRTQFGGYCLAVEKTVFAVVAEGELYLRACEQAQPYIVERKMEPLSLTKRGVPVELNYYRVDGALWSDNEQLLALSQLCLQGAKKQQEERQNNRRLKDLPNMGIRMEMLLRQVGIQTIEMLIQKGAKRSWLLLRSCNKNLGLNVLYALQGAIIGRHQAALPQAMKEELRVWFEYNEQQERKKKREQN
ncbi:TfoX/Sxy family DNA transformation protein [Erwinia sorbitola]|uniref:Competence protein TfoX n=1 Tax=Erwinia sorbitola TaxID=2681984 RepID=A0A6I6EE61_9GAMM|nr:TfoX/Sxy family DNA transformation protein [Erwinia sorbitola]MTD26572.1 competence protein TfoX [Erwinia sorbitola]QGU88154.1 competence protein TfoX [Erwinia sorbitola]